MTTVATVATVTQVPWYYMWSQKYQFFHEVLVNEMKDPNISLEPIHIEQSVLDKELYKTEGCHIKIDLLIKCLKDNMGNKERPYILFTDVDLIVKPGIYDSLKTHIDSNVDMVFLKEVDANIGFILLKVCDEVLTFWQLVKERMLEKVGHDQTYVNELIKDFPGKWEYFNDKFICSNGWDGDKPFVVMQQLSSFSDSRLDFAEKIFYSAQHMNVEPYMKYVPEDIIESIYTFQQILFESHRRAKEELSKSS